jgi:hypothetical protein
VDSGLTTIDTIETDERVNLEVSKVEVNINGVKADEEVNESIPLFRRNMLEKSGSELLARWERLADEDVEFKRFGVDITNIDTAFMGEEDGIALALRRNADIILCI